MLKEERQHIILTEIKSNNKVHSSTLSKRLDVSEDTIRRDLKELSENGHIKKVHGGAMANPLMPEIVKNQKISDQSEHSIIAEKALSLVEENKVILMEGDESNLFLVNLLPKDFSATVFTNSLKIASSLHSFPDVDTFLLGGKVSKKASVTVGLEVINNLQEIHADLCFMEASSMHIDMGITDADRDRTHVKKAMIGASSKVIALCLARRVGRIQPFKIDGFEKIDTMITEVNASNQHIEAFSSKGIKLI
ncbi:MAG: DeoR/GlpR transcriptional regulator [Cyclobacteriaceae bacterium]